MSPTFIVDVLGADEQVRDALRAVGFPAGGPPLNEAGEVTIPWVSAVVVANDAEAAQERVQDVLPSGGGCEVRHVEPV